MARQKKPDAQQMANIVQGGLNIVAGEDSEVRKYLKEISLTELGTDDYHLYDFIRQSLTTELSPKAHEKPIFAALIERIARTSIMLDQIEKEIMPYKGPKIKRLDNIKRQTKDNNYFALQKEHRQCVELFANLKFAQEQKRKGKILATLRKEIMLDDED